MRADDLLALRAILDAGLEPNAAGGDNATLLYHAVDIEGDAATQGEESFHVDATALLIARGADPHKPADDGLTPYEVARRYGHWLALELFDARVR